jgi:ubiquinone/menaquinone biosynthesis C-methylase UbiE
MQSKIYNDIIYKNVPLRNKGSYRKYFIGSEIDIFARFVLKNISKNVNGIKFLDLGVGTGINIEYLLTKVPGEYYGVDYSFNGLAIAQCAGGNVAYVNADAAHLPFDKSEFDVIYCIGLFELEYSFIKYMPEISRVTKKNGLFLFSLWNSSAPLFDSFLNQKLNGSKGYSLHEVTFVLESNDFEIIDYTSTFYLPRALFRIGYKISRVIKFDSIFLSTATMINKLLQYYFPKSNRGNEWVIIARKN